MAKKIELEKTPPIEATVATVSEVIEMTILEISPRQDGIKLFVAVPGKYQDYKVGDKFTLTKK